MGPKILRRAEVEARTGLPKSSLYEEMERGRFPKPIKLTVRRVGWIEADVVGWIEARIAEGRAAA